MKDQGLCQCSRIGLLPPIISFVSPPSTFVLENHIPRETTREEQCFVSEWSTPSFDHPMTIPHNSNLIQLTIIHKYEV